MSIRNSPRNALKPGVNQKMTWRKSRTSPLTGKLAPWDAVWFLEAHRCGRINSSIYWGGLLQSSKSPGILSSQRISSARKVSDPRSRSPPWIVEVGLCIVKTAFIGNFPSQLKGVAISRVVSNWRLVLSFSFLE